MKASVSCTVRFEAAHQLPWHPGACRNLHGHSYRLELTVAGPVAEHGIVVDFDELKTLLHREVVDRYDHRYLNDLLENPTAELIVTDAWKHLEAAGVAVSRLRLWETDDTMVELTAS